MSNSRAGRRWRSQPPTRAAWWPRLAFWAIAGQGFGAENLTAILCFGSAYMLVVLIEPFADLGVLVGIKSLRTLAHTGLFTHRLHHAA